METRRRIVELREQGLSYGQIAKRLEDMKVSKHKAFLTYKRYQQTGSLEDRPRSGRPRSVRTPRVIKSVREKIRRSKKRSMRKMAVEANMSDRSMRRLVKRDLGMRSYHMQKRQLLSEATKAKRLDRCIASEVCEKQFRAKHKDQSLKRTC